MLADHPVRLALDIIMIGRSTATLAVLFLTLGWLGSCSADTPANCTYEEIHGLWNFNIGNGGGDKTIDCSKMDIREFRILAAYSTTEVVEDSAKTRNPPISEFSTLVIGDVSEVFTVDLQFPDLAIDTYGNRGHWTLIYNQGFEVTLHGRKFFAFSRYEGTMENATSFCDETMPGWTHDLGGNDWACFVGSKVKPTTGPKVNHKIKKSDYLQQMYKPDPEFIKEINTAQSLWKAVEYPEYQQMTVGQMMQRAGGRVSSGDRSVRAAMPSREIQVQAAGLPEAFDWRNVNGVNYVSPVRDQEWCGSCYAFASTAMLEARFRVVSNKTVDVILSPQDVVDCANYAQRCNGGFPYLIAGKYAEDYGLVEESCNVYMGEEEPKCGTDPKCKRYHAYGYRYVGAGYYGGCSEAHMRVALFNNGPIAVSYLVMQDFLTYSSGIYTYSGVTRRFNPFEPTNHVVTIVGYGKEAATGMPYWIVQNSWGPNWGEDGFFRIRRGTDECAIESIAMENFPAF